MPLHPRKPGGLIHTYQAYDPMRFPSPTQPPPDMAGAAMDHLLAYGEHRELTEEELREAVRIDPSQIAGLGPSIEALIAMLEERKRKILETYETSAALREAGEAYREASLGLMNEAKNRQGRDGLEAHPTERGKKGSRGRSEAGVRSELERALRGEQIPDLERLWYAMERRDSELAGGLMAAINRLGTKYEVEQLDAEYAFTGREPMSAGRALEIKEELETIDRLLEQLREAKKNAKIGVIDLDELSNFVDEADVEQMRELGRRVEDYMREQAELQGLERDAEGKMRLTPKAVKLFQSKLLDEIFGELEASRSGRHRVPIVGEGAVELAKTREYAFGDSPTHLDLPQTVVNAAVRSGAEAGRGGDGGSRRVRVKGEDIEVHLTRNNPKCATCVLMDMSGSMRHMGQYIQCKRMALGLDGLIRSEFPGDFLQLIEIATFAKARHISEAPGLMPKPVTTRDPVVRLRVDMSDPDVSEHMVHPHFTNIQHGLRLARRFLAGQDTPNRQVFLITDGLPTAHFENGPGTGVGRSEAGPSGSPGGAGADKGKSDGRHLYLLYPPDPLTERATIREAMACKREGITINIFLLPSWSQDEDDIAFAHRLAEQTGGRVIFTSGRDLDRFVLWDYVSHRRKIIG